MKFKATLLQKDGSRIEKEMEAESRSAVYSMLKMQEATLVSLEEVKGGFSFNFQKLNARFSTVKTNDVIIFTKNLGAMIEAGLPVSRALFVLQRQTKNQKFKKVLNELQEAIRKGESLSGGLSRHPEVFSRILVSMVKAGEESGSLSESLKIVSTQMEKTYVLKKKVKGALMYPGIILSVMLVIGVLMLIYVVPTLTATFKELEVELPTSTQIIIFISDFLKDYTLFFMLIVLGIIFGIYALFKNPKGKRFFDYLFLHIPLISGLVKETNSARTARTLASLLSSGVEVVTSINITKDVVQNSYYKEVLVEAEAKVQKGVLLSKIFEEHSDIYPIFVSEMISVGEETGKLSDMLQRIAIFYEEDIDQKTKNMSTIIEPFLMVFIGAAVGFFALSMITPTYSLVDGL